MQVSCRLWAAAAGAAAAGAGPGEAAAAALGPPSSATGRPGQVGRASRESCMHDRARHQAPCHDVMFVAGACAKLKAEILASCRPGRIS
jgi:hypothetical protein